MGDDPTNSGNFGNWGGGLGKRATEKVNKEE